MGTCRGEQYAGWNPTLLNTQIIYDVNTDDPSKPKLLRIIFMRKLSSVLTEPYTKKKQADQCANGS